MQISKKKDYKIKKISIIVPVFNEAENLPKLIKKIQDTRKSLTAPSEVIIINDGSTDHSEMVLNRLSKKQQNIQVLNLKFNSGQTTALMAGIHHSQGDVIIPLDADLQNDPADIPNLLKEIENGYDCVSGWRKNRKDSLVTRNLPSLIANKIISYVSKVPLNDYGCSLKAYKKSSLEGIRLYGEMHRFIPIYVAWNGGRIIEKVVSHSPRIHGKSKYGLERIYKVILDLIVVKFLTKYSQKPIYVFGTFGIAFLGLGFCATIWILWLKLFEQVSFIKTPLPVLVVFLVGTGIISILLGLVAEVVARTWLESHGRKTYQIKK